MKDQDKKLLLRDLCARLPHGVMCQIDEHGKNYKLKGINKHKGIWWYEFDGFRIIKLPKPYLRPMSSMTEEEAIVYRTTCYYSREEEFYFAGIESFDYLLKKHFDYRGLIEKGLALPAKEGMYNI